MGAEWNAGRYYYCTLVECRCLVSARVDVCVVGFGSDVFLMLVGCAFILRGQQGRLAGNVTRFVKKDACAMLLAALLSTPRLG